MREWQDVNGWFWFQSHHPLSERRGKRDRPFRPSDTPQFSEGGSFALRVDMANSPRDYLSAEAAFAVLVEEYANR